MLCPKCGINNADGSKFCYKCGMNLALNNNQNANNQVQQGYQNNYSNQQMQYQNNQVIQPVQQNNNGSQKKKKSGCGCCLFIFLAFVVVVISFIVFAFFKVKSFFDFDVSNKNEISIAYNDNQVPKFVNGKFSDKKVKSSNDALKALDGLKDELKFKNANKEFKLYSEDKVDNVTYYRFQQVYNNVSVYNQYIIVSADNKGNVLSFSGEYIPDIDINVKPSKNKNDIENIVKDYLGENANIVSNELVIYAYGKNDSVLIYDVIGYSDSKGGEILINANNGEIVDFFDLGDYAVYSYTSAGIDDKIYTINLDEDYVGYNALKKVYKFYDPERKISISDYREIGQLAGFFVSLIPGTIPYSVTMDDGKITSGDDVFVKDAVTTMANFETIYDYYLNNLGRKSYDNKGSKIIVNLGVSGKTFSNTDLNNAAWASVADQMFIGNADGKSYSASLDVLAHEFTHGVVSKTSKFAGHAKKGDENKAFEAGALNEGYADVIGHLIDGKNWTMAENNSILRDASNPESYNYPGIKGGNYYYPDGYLKDGRTLEEFLKANNLENVIAHDKGGVHANSNVVSHAAYLMYEAGAFRSKEEMAKVWYNSLFMLSSYSEFEDCAYAVIKSAQNMGLSDSSIYKITKAFIDTKMIDSEEFKLHGIVSDKKDILSDVNINIYSYEDNSLITTIKTNENGEYEVSLTEGTYLALFNKDGYDDYSSMVVLTADTELDVKLVATKKDSNEKLTNNCTSSECIKFTIYYLEGNDNGILAEGHETYLMNKGTVIDANLIVNSVNQVFRMKILSTDGKSFYINVSDTETEMAWYYKGTDIVYEWGKPMNEDVEIEMKLMDGLIDNDTLIDISNLFGNK